MADSNSTLAAISAVLNTRPINAIALGAAFSDAVTYAGAIQAQQVTDEQAIASAASAASSALGKVAALAITALQIGTTTIGVSAFTTSGYATPGVGRALYVAGTSTGPGAVQDAAQNWFQIAPFNGKLDPQMFGCAWDGVTDDTANFIKAASAAAALQTTLFIPPKPFGIVDLSASLPSNLHLAPQAKNRVCGFMRKANATGNFILNFNGVSGFRIDSGLVLDGNKANQTKAGNNINITGCWNFDIGQVDSRNAKLVAGQGLGCGIQITNNLDFANGTYSRVRMREVSLNDGTGFYATGTLYNIDFSGTKSHDNGGGGALFVPNPTVNPSSMNHLSFSDFTCTANGGAGFAVGSFITAGTTTLPQLGPLNYASLYDTARNIRCINNKGYGAQFIGGSFLASQIVALGNGNGQNGFAGIAFGCYRGLLIASHSEGNSFFGVDGGFSHKSKIAFCHIVNNGNAQGGVAVNGGASVGLHVFANYIGSNGDQTNKASTFGVNATRSDTGGSNSFGSPLTVPFQGDGITIESNIFAYDAAFTRNLAVYLSGNFPNARVINNTLRNATAPDAPTGAWTATAFLIASSKCEIRGNVSDSDIPVNSGYTAMPTLVLPDFIDKVRIVGGDAGGGGGNIATLLPFSENYFAQQVTAVKVVPGTGSNITRSCPIVISGGGGTGASATFYPDDTGSGDAAGLVGGTAYTSVPTATANLNAADIAAGAVAPTFTVEVGNVFMKDGIHDGWELFFVADTTVVSGTGNIDLANGLTTVFPANSTLKIRSILGRWKEVSRSTARPNAYAFANLPAVVVGVPIYVTNGRKVGEAAGAGTGVMAYGSNNAWRRYSDDTAVVA